MKALAIVVAIVSIVISIYLIANVVYLRSIKSNVSSTTELNLLFWIGIGFLAIFAGLLVYAIYDMATEKKDTKEDTKEDKDTKSTDKVQSFNQVQTKTRNDSL